MHRTAAVVYLLLALPAFADTPTSAPAQAVPAPAQPELAAPEAFAYGPILAQDAETRVQIKQLYREQHDLELALRERLTDLNAAVAAETDPEIRVQLQRDGMTLKQDHQIQVTEIGLEIARLNGDEQRASEFELALDQMRNPERYLPPTKDPAVAARERALDAGLE